MGSSKIIVMGGIPVGDASSLEGFAAWADTVTKNPMPIKYKLGSFLELVTPLITAYESEQMDEPLAKSSSTDTPKVECPCRRLRRLRRPCRLSHGRLPRHEKTRLIWCD